MSAALAAIAPASSILFTNTSLSRIPPSNLAKAVSEELYAELREAIPEWSSFALLRHDGSSFEVAQILANEIAADEIFVGLCQALCDRP
jgi:hypothetical protein